MLARLAEIEKEEKAEAARLEAQAAARARAGAAAVAAVPPEAVAAITRMVTAQLDQRGYVPKRRTKPSDQVEFTVSDRDAEDTERVQAEFLALIDLLGAVRVPDIIEHVTHKNGGEMTPANIRHHMFKLAADGHAYVAAEQLPVARGAGYRFVMTKTPEDMVRVWKKQPLRVVGNGGRDGKPAKA